MRGDSDFHHKKGEVCKIGDVIFKKWVSLYTN